MLNITHKTYFSKLYFKFRIKKFPLNLTGIKMVIRRIFIIKHKEFIQLKTRVAKIVILIQQYFSEFQILIKLCRKITVCYDTLLPVLR